MIKIYAPCLFAFLSSPAIAGGFQFDNWSSGMSIQEVMAISRDKDVPIHREGLVSVNKGFNSNVNTRYISVNDFYYREKLLGENAKVDLIFTPESKFLSTVKIRWLAVPKSSLFRRRVFDVLTHKYGKHSKKQKSSSSKNSFGESIRTTW